MTMRLAASRSNILAAERRLVNARHNAANAIFGLRHALRARLAQLPVFALTVGLVVLICWRPRRRDGSREPHASNRPSIAAIIMGLVIRSFIQQFAVTLVALWRRKQWPAGEAATGVRESLSASG
jgi:hypothetical protein